jgi:hypothetical protein
MSTEPKIDFSSLKKKKRKKPSKRAIRLAPQKFDLLYERENYVPLSNQLSSRSSGQPFSWISLDDGGERDKAIFEFGVKDGKYSMKEGMTSLSVKNEKGSYPQVDFEVLCPTALNATNADDRIDTIKRGTRLYVYFGYTHAITKLGPYRVKEKSVEYGEGKIILKVTATMGHKLNTTTTSNIIKGRNSVLRSGQTFNVLDTLAGMGDFTIDYEDLLNEELVRIRDIVDSKGADQTVGQRMWNHVSHLDVDFWLDPKENTIKLATPYAFDLKELGKTAYRMTYGLPTSNIKKITYTEKMPSRKSTGSKKDDVGNTQTFSGGFINEEEKVAEILRHGYLRIANTSSFFFVGDPDKLARHYITGQEEADPALSIKNFNRRYKNTKKWKVVEDQDFNLETEKYIQYKVFEKVKGLNVEDLGLGNGRLVTLKEFREIQSKNNYVVITGQPQGTGLTDVKIPIRVFRKGIAEGSNKKSTKKSVTKGKPKSSTRTLEPTEENTYIEEDVLDTYFIFNRPNKEYTLKNKKTEKEIREKYLDIKNPDNVSIRVKKVRSGQAVDTYQVIRYTERKGTVKVRKDPKKIEPPKEQTTTKNQEKSGKDKDKVTTASSDGKLRGRKKPSSKGGKAGQGNNVSRRGERELTIELATGDWTLPLGTVLELIDLNDSVSGFYVVNSEEHNVDNQGFKTTLKCSIGLSKKPISKTPNPNTASTRKNKSDPRGGLIRVRKKKVAEIKEAQAEQRIKKRVQEALGSRIPLGAFGI